MALEEQNADINYFSLDGYETKAKVVKVYDGDTVHVVFQMFDKYYKWNCRILHVDTPELRTKDLEEKKRGYECRDKLAALILDKIVLLNCSKFDKYGRLLVEITVPETGVKIHEYLISEGLANKYEGKTKEKWDFSNEEEEKPKVEKPKAEKVVKPKAEKPKAEKVEKPKAEKPKAEKAEKPKVEKPKAEKPKAETS